ncbi:TetR/AcrR family transcriptional regulator [Phenylobacterium sp.]|uniref:TetR/AcrR family transcriptional regulator n=1 Tax=Phenylobacterium sp. TaxID=1871053 RepID=UPI0027365406|nr:TetR/AcrR family transcriptional regulator [Phenylobacterium sp.]MDP3852208.1 TetR/AcrR family transcriptional regulator [Phenylobacterium sp.]
MSTSSTPFQRKILSAAKTVFSRHGFQRASMADVAQVAGVSRAALYVNFLDKAALFQALAKSIISESLEAAAAAWEDGASLEANLKATILAKDLPIYRLLHLSPHGGELLNVDVDLTSSTANEMDKGFAEILRLHAEKLERTGQAEFSVFSGCERFGSLVTALAGGLKHELKTDQSYIDGVGALSKVVARSVEKRSKETSITIAT